MKNRRFIYSFIIILSILLAALFAYFAFISDKSAGKDDQKEELKREKDSDYANDERETGIAVFDQVTKSTPTPEPTRITPSPTKKIEVTSIPTIVITPPLNAQQRAEKEVCAIWGSDCELGMKIVKQRNPTFKFDYVSIQKQNIGLFTVYLQNPELREYYDEDSTNAELKSLMLEHDENIKFAYHYFKKFGYSQTLSKL